MTLAEYATTGDDDELDLRAYLTVLRRRWKGIVLAVLLIGGIAVGLSLSQPEKYRARADVLIRQRSTEALFSEPTSATGTRDAERLLNNEVGVLESGTFQALVEDAYDGPLNPRKVRVNVSSDAADVVTVSATGTDPDEAAELVNLYVATYIESSRERRVEELLAAGAEIQSQIDALSTQIATVRVPLDGAEAALGADPTDETLIAQRDDVAERVQRDLEPLESRRAFYQQQLEDLQLTAGIASSGGAEVLTEARPPTLPVSPKPMRDGAIGVLVGMLIGVAAAFVLDNLDERIRSISDVERATGGLPALALVPEIEGRPEPTYVPARDDPRSPSAEAYRSLRTAIKFAALERPIKVIQITSASSGEGKTITLANLAVAFAQGGDRVAVVCCDLRRPKIHERFSEPLTPGFTDVLVGDEPLSQAVRRYDSNIYVLPAGSPPPNPSELLSTQRAGAVISAMAEEFDVVLLDSTPVLPVTDALVVSRLVDATLVVIDARMTKRNALKRTLQMLGQVNAPVLGLVLNGVRSGGAYGYAYGYGYGTDEKTARRRLRSRQATPTDAKVVEDATSTAGDLAVAPDEPNRPATPTPAHN